MRTAGQVRDELAKLAAYIASARRLVADGNLVDIAALTPRIGALCAAVQALPPAEGSVFGSELQALMSKLDGLGADIRHQIDRLAAAGDDGRG